LRTFCLDSVYLWMCEQCRRKEDIKNPQFVCENAVCGIACWKVYSSRRRKVCSACYEFERYKGKRPLWPNTALILSLQTTCVRMLHAIKSARILGHGNRGCTHLFGAGFAIYAINMRRRERYIGILGRMARLFLMVLGCRA
jgi:hypothetical protein